MKKVYAVLALTLAVGGVAFALEETPQPAQEVLSQTPKTGSGRIAKLRADYDQGKFNFLFDSLEVEYAELKQSGRVNEFAEMRRVGEANEQIKGLSGQFDKMAADLLQERNSELKALCEGSAAEAAALYVQSITSPLDESQAQAMRALSALRFKAPDQAANEDERALIEIDLAYEFKSVHLGLHQSEEGDLTEKQIVLGMDKMQKMVQASESFTDASLKETVANAALGFDEAQAKYLDMRELSALAKTPSSDFERSIGAILVSYKAQKDDLYQKEFLAKL